MLLQFYFSNYRLFEGEGILDMRASGSNELSSHIRNSLNEKILPVTAIYGAMQVENLLYLKLFNLWPSAS